MNARAHSNMSYTSYPYSVDPMRTPPREGQEEIALIKLGWRVLRGQDSRRVVVWWRAANGAYYGVEQRVRALC